jgi:hypothetical protein
MGFSGDRIMTLRAQRAAPYGRPPRRAEVGARQSSMRPSIHGAAFCFSEVYIDAIRLGVTRRQDGLLQVIGL